MYIRNSENEYIYIKQTGNKFQIPNTCNDIG